MHAFVLAAAIVATSSGVNLGRIAPWQSDPTFVNLYAAHNGIRSSNGVVSNDGRTIPLNDLGFPASLEPDQRGRVSIRLAARDFPTMIRGEWVGGAVDLHSPDIELLTEGTDANSGHYQEFLVHRPTTLRVDITQAGVTDLNVYYNEPRVNETFRDEFITSLQPFDVLRTMDWNLTNNSTVSRWDQRPTLNEGWGSGVPYETMIGLSNAAEKDLWLTIPHMADADYQLQLANLVATQLDPDRKVWVEYSNEVWNSAFQQHHFVKTLDGFTNTSQAYGAQSQALFDQFTSVLGEDRVVTVLSGHGVSPGVIQQALQQASSPDKVAIGAYFRVDPPDMQTIFERFTSGERPADEVFSMLRESLNSRIQFWRQNGEIAATAGAELVAYEGGQSLVSYTGEQRGNREFTSWLATLQYDPRMGELYDELHAVWDDLGGKAFAHYTAGETWTPAGSWGLRENFSTTTPKWESVLRWLEAEDPTTSSQPRDYGRWDGSRYYPVGDSNYDQRFETSDLVTVFAAGEYEDMIDNNSTWEEGDWNVDGDFTTADLVLAFTVHGGAIAAVAAPTPEPASMTSVLIATLFLGTFRRRR